MVNKINEMKQVEMTLLIFDTHVGKSTSGNETDWKKKAISDTRSQSGTFPELQQFLVDHIKPANCKLIFPILA